MRKLRVLLVAVVAVSLASCNYQKTNRIEQKDVRKGDQWVYGVSPDSAARQLKNKYTANPDLEVKANKIREILYGKTGA
ncbi:hypothetical protein [Emticicia soli]|uniref:Uncharacterized protein n=1 Tax=Emticicia soli TaxID=2027878 RepID=A0ABW5JDN8_9BACT